jgi:hypothetical protein
VIASNTRINEIKLQNRKLLGIEMEAYGIYYACTQIFESRITPIVINQFVTLAMRIKMITIKNMLHLLALSLQKSFATSFINNVNCLASLLISNIK